MLPITEMRLLGLQHLSDCSQTQPVIEDWERRDGRCSRARKHCPREGRDSVGDGDLWRRPGTACVGAGLRAFTKYARVEFANGEEVPAERFLAEVETVVLETIMGKLSMTVGAKTGQTSLAGLDPAARFYILWRYTYGTVELDAGEAIIFANGTHVELGGLRGLSSGTRPLVGKKKNKYRLLEYGERGDDAKLGTPSDDGQAPSLIDALHRLLWLMERHPSSIPEFLRDARPNIGQLRLVAEVLAGPALKGGELGEVASGSELAALMKLTANWRSVVEDVDLTGVELEARRAGQSRIQFDQGGRR